MFIKSFKKYYSGSDWMEYFLNYFYRNLLHYCKWHGVYCFMDFVGTNYRNKQWMTNIHLYWNSRGLSVRSIVMHFLEATAFVWFCNGNSGVIVGLSSLERVLRWNFHRNIFCWVRKVKSEKNRILGLYERRICLKI